VRFPVVAGYVFLSDWLLQHGKFHIGENNPNSVVRSRVVTAYRLLKLNSYGRYENISWIGSSDSSRWGSVNKVTGVEALVGSCVLQREYNTRVSGKAGQSLMVREKGRI